MQTPLNSNQPSYDRLLLLSMLRTALTTLQHHDAAAAAGADATPAKNLAQFFAGQIRRQLQGGWTITQEMNPNHAAVSCNLGRGSYCYAFATVRTRQQVVGWRERQQ